VYHLYLLNKTYFAGLQAKIIRFAVA